MKPFIVKRFEDLPLDLSPEALEASLKQVPIEDSRGFFTRLVDSLEPKVDVQVKIKNGRPVVQVSNISISGHADF